MVALLNPIQTPRRRPNLLLHCGARAVEREQVMDSGKGKESTPAGGFFFSSQDEHAF